MNELEVLDHETINPADTYAMRTVEVMSQWGNGEIYDKRAVIERGRMAIQHAVLAIYELGRVLIILKELVPHGEFTEIVESQFDITMRSAQNYMLATRRFATEEMKRVQNKFIALGHSKLLVLLSEATDDQIIELADGGEFRGKELDEYERMTHRELRATFKSKDDDIDASRRRIAEKDAEINKLKDENDRLKRKRAEVPPVDVAEEIKQTMNAHEAAALSQIYQMRAICEQLIEHGQIHNMDHTPAMVGSINQIIRACESLRETFHLPRDAPTDEIPAWLKDEG